MKISKCEGIGIGIGKKWNVITWNVIRNERRIWIENETITGKERIRVK